ncbi:MAG: ABC-F family ATP-binding cassette domain-containing protein, partial [Planctomycetes bacterium]|nr:ABC-F family ATP-binding cassette domain-containing protein [Planctomycetota bacterium]
MPLLTLSAVSFAYAFEPILDDVSFAVEPGQRIALVGRNGAGKTTLLNIVAGRIEPDSGTRSIAKTVRIGVLDQHPTLDPDETLRGEAEAAFAQLHELHRRIDDLYARMADDDANTQQLMNRLGALEREMEAKGGYAVGHRIDAILHGLGFSDDDFTLPVSGLSGGQRSRLALAKLLLDEPDLLLLDEPTNHLDAAGCEWLEQFLAERFTGAVVMVSHDRYMLDRVVGRIVEVEHARLIEYPGSFSQFREIRAQRRLTQLRAHEKQQTRFKRQEHFIARFKEGQRAKQARGRQTRLDRERRSEAIERPLELDTFNISFPPAPRPGDLVAIVRDAAVTFATDSGEDFTLFSGLSLTVSRGERWGIIGPNGVGKTTLIRAILGEVALTAGSARLGTNVHVGYFQQTLEAPDDTPVYRFIQGAIRRENPDLALSEQAARDLAGAFLFSGDDQDSPMNELSGGEHSRARLAALLASARNLLVLDEPTNHLDIPSAERLEQTLKPTKQGGAYDGTLILVSHDRALIDALCDHLLVFDGRGGVTVYHGNYTQWREHVAAQAGSKSDRPALKAKSNTSAPTVATDSAPSAAKRNPFSWMRHEQLEQRI